VRTIRVLLATLVAVPLLAWSASALAITWILRDVERPVPSKEALTFVHRGLACIEPSPAQRVAIQHRPQLRGRTLTGIAKEVALRVWLDRRYEPDELIRLQGDTAWFGRGAYGVEAGARAWFGKPAKELSTAQAALLVGMLQYPAKTDPTRHHARALKRRQYVLGAWQLCGLIPPGTAISLESVSVLDGLLQFSQQTVRGHEGTALARP
jgi:hypothetical protein